MVEANYVIKQQLGTDFYPIFYILDSLKSEVVQEHPTISRQANQGVPALTE